MTWEVHEADCLEAMREMDECSVDAIVTDPPYGLEFMGKEWDRLGDVGQASHQGFDTEGNFKGFKLASYNASANVKCRRCRKWKWDHEGRKCECQPFGDFPNLKADQSRRMQEWHQAWATEALRVLKPGGHLLAFGGTRTYHRLACAVEDAGFEIRDSVIWLYGSGFPKSLNLNGDHAGWGTALKPAHEPIVVARKPLVGTVAENVTRFGTGALNIDGCRIEGEPLRSPLKGDGTRSQRVGNEGWDRPWKHGEQRQEGERWQRVDLGPIDGYTDDEAEAIEAERRAVATGRWPPNVALSHLDECEAVGERRVKNPGGVPSADSEKDSHPTFTSSERTSTVHHFADDGMETVTEWRCAPGCAVAELDRQSGEAGGGYATRGASTQIYGGGKGFTAATGEEVGYGDTGGASRFFYCAKSSTSERSAGLHGERNIHPTCKPVSLMRWLCRLVTPPGGVLLDPFVGSGTTGAAAVLEGFDFIGIEREAEYVEIARARIAWWEQHKGREADEVLAASAKSERERSEHEAAGQIGLFEEAA